MPPPDGMMNRPDEYTSWLFRRNYSWSIIENSHLDTSWWGATSRDFTSPTYTGPDGWESVLCAVNTFGQDDLFRFKITTRPFNGYCLRNPRRAYVGGQAFGPMHRAARCLITFGASNSKRGVEFKNGTDWSISSMFCHSFVMRPPSPLVLS